MHDNVLPIDPPIMNSPQKPLIPSMCFFLSGSSAIVLGVLFQHGLLRFMQRVMNQSDVKQVPEQFVHLIFIMFFVAGTIILTLGIIGVLTLNDERRRYIASLPLLQRWMFWPF